MIRGGLGEYFLGGGALIIAIYHLASVFYVVFPGARHYVLHIMMVTVFALGFDFVAKPRHPVARVVIIATGVGVLVSLAYIAMHETRLGASAPFLDTADLVVGAVLIIGMIVISGIIWGPVFPLLSSLGLLYFLFGQHVPWVGHTGFSFSYVISYMGMGLTDGIFFAAPLSADILFFFLLYGGILHGTGVVRSFSEIGKALGNRLGGGPAFPAVVASAAIGTFTGQAISNIALSGSFTIPMMRRANLRAPDAAAIEVVASTGSQITPPVMGLAGFLMASFIGVPYAVIMAHAVIPAALYYLIVAIGILFLTASLGLTRKKEEVNASVIASGTVTFVASLLVIVALMFWRYSEGYAATIGIITVVGMVLVIGPLFGQDRPGITEFLGAVRSGVRMAAELGAGVVSLGIFVQAVITTGFGTRAAIFFGELTGGEFWPVALLVIMVMVVFGSAIPTPIAYMLAFLTVIPVMVDAGMEVLPAHLFAFYFAIFSTMTPPVAVGAMTAARLAQTSWLNVCLSCWTLALPLVFIPLAFLRFPGILRPSAWGIFEVVLIMTIVLGSTTYFGARFGYLAGGLRWPARLGLGLATACAGAFVVGGEPAWLVGFGAMAVFGLRGKILGSY